MNSPSKNVLVAGSWAKEHITVEKLKENPRLKVFAYMSIENPGIMSLADGYKIGKLDDTRSLRDYAEEIKANLVLITTACPLAAGAADKLRENGIPVFAPGRSAARLETDKAYARKLMRRNKIDALPEFGVFNQIKPAVDFAEKMDWQVAVKPIGLTEGLGVKVYGQQLKDNSQVVEYISDILKGKFSKNSSVLIEEKLKGEEFTLQCLVNGTSVVPTPAVQDFKKLLDGDRGPNTASMGSYTSKDFLLPFMGKEDYRRALDIIRQTLRAFSREKGKNCLGILYGQFMITAKGLKLIEYNFRPGDPEWLNTCSLLKGSLFDVIDKLLRGKKVKMEFKKGATVCKYLVPPRYPRKLNRILDISIDEKAAKQNEVSIYYSCGYDEEGNLNVGSERGIALLARGNTVERAKEKIHRTVEKIQGDFRYRRDIGTKKMTKSKIERVDKIKKAEKR